MFLVPSYYNNHVKLQSRELIERTKFANEIKLIDVFVSVSDTAKFGKRISKFSQRESKLWSSDYLSGS